MPWQSAPARPVGKWPVYPFTLGVAAGTPAQDGFVIWTRLAPEPLFADPLTPGGMRHGDIAMTYEIATDETLRNIVQSGRTMAVARHGHSVHAQVRGLQPGRPYWYRFRSGDAFSRIGRAMTLPSNGAMPERVTLGCVSCANYEQGYFAAYRHLAAAAPDLVLFLGDYIYEYLDKVSTDLVRKHSDGVEATNLHTYRNRYAQYRLDADLQQLHAVTTALMTWDDHELVNDYAGWLSTSTGKSPPEFTDPEQFKRRRSAAYQAFYEHMPVPPARLPHAGNLRIYQSYQLGGLLQIFMTDTRQYRSAPPCFGPPDGVGGRIITANECRQLADPARSMYGATQEAWLSRGFARSTARWNLLGQSVLMADVHRRNALGDPSYWTDDWNGYPASRQRLLQQIHDCKLANPVVVSGDAHAFFANDLRLDSSDADSPPVATEFVGTSVSSKAGFDYTAVLPENPQIRFFDRSVRGYVAIDLQKSFMTTRFMALSDPRDPQATLRTLKEFVVADTVAGVVPR